MDFAKPRDLGASDARPLILVAPRYEPGVMHRDEMLAPSEAIATVFMDGIIAAGGLPLLMPLTTDESVIDTYVDMADGVAIPGGPDVNPRRWGDEGDYDESLLCEPRDEFEFPLVERVLAADKPLFTTCRGAQLLNVALGGTLCMDVPSWKPREGMTLWRHTMILRNPVHEVEVMPDTLLSRVLGGAERIQVNSAHHCCVDRLGEGVRLVAEATDGVPEAIEVPSKRFCLGVQWHPEYTWQTIPTDLMLWRGFVNAAAGR